MEVQDQLKTIRRASSRKQKGEIAVVLPEENGSVIVVATNKELSSEHYYRRLWIVMKYLSDELSRRQLVALCIAYYRDMYGKVHFQWPDGTPYVLPEWDIWFRDPEARWLSYYLEQCNGLPKRRSHLYSRLRVFDAFIRARWPKIAKRIRE